MLSNYVRVHIKPHVPIPPEGVRAQGVSEGVLIMWDETVQKDVSGYNVYRYERGRKHELLATLNINTNEFIDKKVRNGNLYFYYITCIDGGKNESAPSREISIRP